MSLVDLLLVPEAKSFFSTNATDIPLEAASKAIPAPVTPPPTINTSNSFEVNSLKVFSLSKKEKLFINSSNYKTNFIEIKFQKVYSDRPMKDTFLLPIIFYKNRFYKV